MPDWGMGVWGMMAIVLGSGLFAPITVYGQDHDSDAVRQRALEAFHGPDLEGKDGPLSRVGFDLALLYYEWKAYREEAAGGDFIPSASSMPVRDGRVTVDATATRDAAALQRALEDLGLAYAARAGHVVSGRLPIPAIPEAAQLAGLQAMRPARAMTHRPPAAPSDTVAGRPGETPDRERENRTYWYVIGGVAVVAAVAAVLLLRR